MLKALGRYVELASKDDEATFISSGFVPKATARASAAQPLPQPTIAKIEQGNSGQLSVSATPVHQKALFEMRYAPAVPGGTPSNWIYGQVHQHAAASVNQRADAGHRVCFPGLCSWKSRPDRLQRPRHSYVHLRD
jgi:hypothetical protein